MKKIFVSLFIIAASLNAMATDFAVATLTLKGNTSLEQGEVTLVKTDDPNASSYCAPINSIDLYQVIMFAINGSENYQIWANADLENLALGFKTYSDANYTITVSNVSGSETLNLYDAVADKTIALTDGATYEFAAAANQTITNRFSVVAAAPATPKFCFELEKLTVKGFNGKKLSIAKKDGTVVVAEFTLGDEYEYDFQPATVEAGKYIIKFNGETAVNNDENVMKEYVIDVKPTVTPL